MSQSFNYNQDYYEHRLQQLEAENRPLRVEQDFGNNLFKKLVFPDIFLKCIIRA
jgi:hypothetical protein